MKMTIHPNVEGVIYILEKKKKKDWHELYIKKMLINKNICVLINNIIFFKIL